MQHHNIWLLAGQVYVLRDLSGPDGTVLLQVKGIETSRRMEITLTLTLPDTATGGGGMAELVR